MSCCPTGGSAQHSEDGHAALSKRAPATPARRTMAMIAATAPSHRTATAMTFAKTTHKIANMVAMLTHRTCRLKMPRPAAYPSLLKRP